MFWATFMIRNVGKPTNTNSNELLVLTLKRLCIKLKNKNNLTYMLLEKMIKINNFNVVLIELYTISSGYIFL